MSGYGAKKEKDSSSGSGLFSGLLLAGGAAAMGFLAKTMYDDYKEFQANEKINQERRWQFYKSDNGSGPQPSTRKAEMKEGLKDDPEKEMKEGLKDDPEKKGEDISEATRCVVCMDNVRQVIIEPCGHVCLCNNCAQKIVQTKPRCPVCHTKIANIKPCYLP